jgi:type IV pilus assembly protein PilZ
MQRAEHRRTVEKRRHERVSVDLAVELAVPGRESRLPARARDLSVGGMQVASTSTLPVSTEVVAHVWFPDQDHPLALPAVVRWAREGGLGLQFGLLGARETHAITELMTGAPRDE